VADVISGDPTQQGRCPRRSWPRVEPRPRGARFHVIGARCGALDGAAALAGLARLSHAIARSHQDGAG